MRDSESNVVIEPATRVLHDLLSLNVRRTPHATALVDGRLRLTYKELAQSVDKYAKGLIASGIKNGDRIATLAPSCGSFWIQFLAATSIGAIWHGINPRYKIRDYSHILHDAAPRLLFCVSPFDGRHYDSELQALESTVESFITIGDPRGAAVSEDKFLSRGHQVSEDTLVATRAGVGPEDISVIIYTSGTTGRPKGAMLSHRALVASATENAKWMGNDALACAIQAAPINHVGALNNICLTILAAGGKIIFLQKIIGDEVLEISQREKATMLLTSPTGFILMMESPSFSFETISDLKRIVHGGAKTPRDTLKLFSKSNALLTSVYGQTETCGNVIHTEDDCTFEVMSEVIGKPLTGAKARIRRSDGAICVADEPGELEISSPYNMSGYYNDPESTKAAFTEDGYLRTGDICSLRNDGNLVFVGRLKEMYRSGGYNIFPVEIEQAICEHPNVLMAAVLPVPDAKFQEVGYAFIMPEPGISVTEQEIIEFLNERIANYKRPKSFSIEQTLPLLPNTKIDKQALKRRLLKGILN